jgi:hypothetical protein
MSKRWFRTLPTGTYATSHSYVGRCDFVRRMGSQHTRDCITVAEVAAILLDYPRVFLFLNCLGGEDYGTADRRAGGPGSQQAGR